ncbi:hypothetical protein OIDMADRAFT_22734 [Oidiodendron maius Zn]|uniref:Uncharacterized protein n=1 Tax=Oidiodendron maius (strain Zn) TaxID=913774 RepID=A0A0C3HI60_OIDMZ|nr:hypothetical protein OIDMADRAFT_22734 [Oidiodendron maius Zn]
MPRTNLIYITHLQQLATNAIEKQFIKAGIPKKYWRIVKNLPVLITACIQSARESKIDFAKLLISEGPDAHNYQFWKEIFPLLYGDPVEQVAERENVYETLAKLELSDA